MRTVESESGAYNGEVPDVNEGEWYADIVKKAVDCRIIEQGVNFRPGDKITREEMCVLLVKCHEYENGIISAAGNIGFNDVSDISDTVSVSKAVSAGFMQGREDGSFAPAANSTRAEAAAVICRKERGL